MRTSGWARRKAGSRGTICWRASATGAVTRSRPRGMAARSLMPAKAVLICANALPVASANCWPASVRRTLRVVRSTSGTPAARSRSAMRWLIAALLTPSRCAAAVKLPSVPSTLSQCTWLHSVSMRRVSVMGFTA